MYDPFPFRVPPVLARATDGISSRYNLDTLPLHIHEILLAFAFYHFTCTRFSPALSRRFFPRIYPALNERTKLNWDVHVVSLVQSTIISGLALWVMWTDKERSNMDWRERVWGYTGGMGMIEGLAAGYFVWDLWISTLHVDLFGIGLWVHAASALWVFGLGFRPFVNYYAPSFILFELSSPFLNIHWFCDKLNMTGSNLQLYNGILLMVSFFGSRLAWGVWQAYCVFTDVFRALEYQQTAAGKSWLAMAAETSSVTGLVGGKAGQVMRYAAGKEVPTWMAYTYLGSNLTLTLLNVYWFGKMIATIRARFEPPFGTKRVVRKTEAIMGRGIDDSGVKSVEVASTQTRQRKGKSSKAVPEPPPPN